MNRFLILGLVFTLSLKARAQTEAAPAAKLAVGTPIRYSEMAMVATLPLPEMDHPRRSRSWLTALYLRPVEEKVVNRAVWPLVPALLLEADPTLSVTTSCGPKTVSQLKKGDVLYRYEPTTRQVSTWEVGIVKRKSRKAESRSALVTANGGFLFENRVAMDQ